MLRYGSGARMRKLKLDDKSLTRLLDELDAQDAQSASSARPPVHARETGECYSYRIRGLRLELDAARDRVDMLVVPTRKLSSDGVFFLAGGLIHTGCSCRAHLVTIRNNWQTVSGHVASCRYVPGSPGAYELFMCFERPIDPASFAQDATRLRILAADDSPVARSLYARLLDKLNVELTCVEDGVEVVEKALSGVYDLILMDIVMPGVDGLAATQMLRSKGYVRPIVAVSALSEPADRERCLAAGCDDFLAKPLSRENLADVIVCNKPEPLVSTLLYDSGMSEVIDGFVGGLVDVVAKLEAAYGTQDDQGLIGVACALKGEAAGIGFAPITEAADGLERGIRSGEDVELIRAKLVDLIRLCLAARPATNRRPDKHDAPETAAGIVARRGAVPAAAAES